MQSADRGRRGQRGQSSVEFTIGSIVLLLLLLGLADFARAYYFDLGLSGAAYSGARHAAWFDFGGRQNVWLDDGEVVTAVNPGLAGSGLATVTAPVGTCPTGTGGVQHNPPYDASLYPTGYNTVKLYICYTKPGSATSLGSLASAPGPYDYSWRQGDVNVILLMNYGLVTSFMQGVLNAAGGIHIASSSHFTIQGGY